MALKPDAGWKNLRIFNGSGLTATLDGMPLALESGRPADPEDFLRASLDESLKVAGPRANVRILIDPDLGTSLWESVSHFGTPIVLSPRISLVRESRFPFSASPHPTPPLQLLIVAADPGLAHQAELAFLEREVAAVEAALQAGECRSIQVTVQRYCTPGALKRLLAQSPVNIFHFVGHGEIGATGPALLFEGAERSEPARVYADELAQWLRDAGVQLAVFGGCRTQELAAVVADEGVTATLGFSGPINDAAAMSFSRALYATLAHRESIEDALLSGRLAIQGIAESWSQPILFLAEGAPRSWSLFHAEEAPALPARRHNLEYDARPFIGRVSERSELAHRLVDLKERLVTITGMGGMGKTRLSRQLTGELASAFADGAWFIECDGLESRAELAAQAAVALELEDKGEDSLKAWLANRNALLVFDCFERVVSQAQLLEDLLLDAPGLSILVTSRIVLGLPREHEYQLPPMNLKGARGQSAESLSLFEEAGRHARRDFKLSARDLPLARRICQMLEGVPLAIVLAAGRLRHVSLAELATYIEERPHDILRTTRDPLSRHGSLTTVVGDSFVLIDEADRLHLIALGAFGGAFTASDAEIVLAQPNVFDVIGRLRDNSLIETYVTGEASRYKLLDSVRDYLSLVWGDSTLAPAASAARDRHVALMMTKGAKSRTLIKEGRWQTGTKIILLDLPNFRAAIRRAISTENHDAVTSFAMNLGGVFFESGMWSDLEILSTEALKIAEMTKNHEVRSTMLSRLGALASRRKDEDSCTQFWLQRVAACEEAKDVPGLTDALGDLAWQAYEQSDIPASRNYLAKSLRMARADSNNEMVAGCLMVAAQIAAGQGEMDKTRRLINRSQRYLEKCEDMAATLYVLQSQVFLYGKLGDSKPQETAARRLIVRSVECHRPVHLGWALLQLSQMHKDRGETEKTLISAMAALKLHSEFASRYLDRAKSLVTSLKKELGESAESRFAELSAMSWRKLVNLLELPTDPHPHTP